MSSTQSASAPMPTSSSVRSAGGSGVLMSLLLGVAIFVPGHLFGWLVEWLWLAGTCVVAALVVANRGIGGNLAGWSATTWLTLFGTATALSCVTVGISVAIRHAAFDARDLAELARLPIYALLSIAVASLARDWNVRAIDRVVAASMLFVIGCTFVYLTRFPVLYQLLNDFVYSDAKVMFDAGYIRISYPFSNPNFLAFYLLLVLGYTAFFSPRPAVFFAALFALFLTGSRSGWLAALPILGAAYAAYAYRATTRSLGLGTIVVWATPIVLAALAVHFADRLQQFARLAELVDALGEGSVAGVHTADVRLAAAEQLLRWVERAPLLGWGPGRGLGIDLADNQYLSWALAWGAAGTALMLLMLVMLFGRLLMRARTPIRAIGAIALALSVAAMLFTGDFLENYRLFFVCIAFVQACYLVDRSRKSDSASRSG